MANKLTNPFKGLKPYRKEDYGKLFGRDKDLVLMKDRIFKGKTTLLFAGTGVGKTSLLNAKVIPELEPRYFVFYHNEWAVDDPLVAVKQKLAAALAVKKPHLEDGGHKDYFKTDGHSLKDFFERYGECRGIFILDQFEELFRYHAYESYFQNFLREICEIINDGQLDIRIVFAMRQEFLGDLSIFDNRIPDLFNNYYHLTHPDKIQAEEIVTMTAALGADKGDSLTVTVDEKALELLINDLAKIEKDVKAAKEPADSKKRELQRDFIEPPYLQIVCQRLWNEQADAKSSEATTAFHFLENYQPGSARKILEGFCHEKLNKLSTREKDVIAAAFDFLVTAHGSKRAYDLDSLARYMKKGNTRLLHTLEKLGAEEGQMLRITRRPDNSIWFELYHDMFSAIVYTWKETYQKKRRRSLIIKNSSIAAITAVFLSVICSLTYPYIKETLTVRPLQNKFYALKAGEISAEEFKKLLLDAKVVVPDSVRVVHIENQYKTWNLDHTNKTLEESPGDKKPPIKTTQLRSVPINKKDKYLSDDTVRSMLKTKGFFDLNWNKSAQGFQNYFESQSDGKIVYDKATGLGWQQSGFDKFLTFEEAEKYIVQINHENFAGHNDWRLPTLEEAMSLMEPARNEDGLYINPVFRSRQQWIWTSDRNSDSSPWAVYFANGSCGYSDFNGNYVRAVR